MKLKEDLDLETLYNYGFNKVEKDDYDEESFISDYEYVFNCGHSRRGQYYYVLIHANRTVLLYASKPDGSGRVVGFPQVILRMYDDGLINN